MELLVQICEVVTRQMDTREHYMCSVALDDHIHYYTALCAVVIIVCNYVYESTVFYNTI
jgi:hypothetical protein